MFRLMGIFLNHVMRRLKNNTMVGISDLTRPQMITRILSNMIHLLLFSWESARRRYIAADIIQLYENNNKDLVESVM